MTDYPENDPRIYNPPVQHLTDSWLPRWLVPLLLTLFLLSTIGAIGGGWYIAHRIDVDTNTDAD